MTEHLDGLYHLQEPLSEQELYLQDLAEQCAVLEEQVRQMAENMPVQKRHLIEDYIAMRDDLEVQSVRKAIRFGKRLGAAGDRKIG